MNLLVTTRADAVCANWVELTHPIIRRYAERIGADFIVLTSLRSMKISAHVSHSEYSAC